jgi:PTH1 family peptidyl-tRNA hydrolase
MDPAPAHVVVGLGNPGQAYRLTRHNIGFAVLDRLAALNRMTFSRTAFEAAAALGSIGGVAAVLVKPLAYMNCSGPPVKAVLTHYGISCEAMVVVHDDIDLALGRLKIKEKGGHGGHNGLKSLIDALGSGNFIRLRMGIGRPETGMTVTDHVLTPFSDAQRQVVEPLVENACRAATVMLSLGTREAMNRFNVKRTTMTNS